MIRKYPMKIRETILYASAATLIGLLGSLVWQADTDEQKLKAFEESVRLTAPEQEETAYGAFSLRLLQATMQTQPGGNVLVTPNALAALLSRLKELSGGAAQEALNALPLPTEWTMSSVAIHELAFLFPDTTVPLCPGREMESDIIAMPFHRSVSDAFVSINKEIALYSANALEHTAGSETVSTDTRLMVFDGVAFQAAWSHTVDREDTLPGDFFNGSGGMPRVPMMCHRGEFRVARADNGAWEAVALFFRNSVQEGDTACMVAILPRESSARTFAAQNLTPAMLADIRNALYKAKPEPGLIELPRLIYPAVVQDMRATLSQLGLAGLFMEEAPFPKLSKQTPLHIDKALQQCSVQLTEAERPLKKEDKAQEASVLLRFDRPFVWFIGKLTSPEQPYLMGVVEDL